jgi:hypothetical protein
MDGGHAMVRASDSAAQRRAKAIRDEADGVGGGPLGDPTTLEMSALYEVLNRPPPRPRGRIPIADSTDGAAVLARVLSEADRATRKPKPAHRREADGSSRL